MMFDRPRCIVIEAHVFLMIVYAAHMHAHALFDFVIET